MNGNWRASFPQCLGPQSAKCICPAQRKPGGAFYSNGATIRKELRNIMGRPTKFKPEFVEQATKLCKLGATDIEVADFFGIDARTLYRWKADNDAFCQALKSGKAEADDRVERSLFSRATGYEHDEVDLRVIGKALVKTPIRKHYPPDTTAAIFWLKNRRAAEWRDRQEIEHGGKDGKPIQVATTLDVSGLSTLALAEIMAARDAAK